MGCTSDTTETKSSQTQDQTQSTTFKPRSSAEQALIDQFSGLGTAQRDALLSRIQSFMGGASPFALDPASQQLLDQSFGSAQQQLALQNKDYADFLSGGRGLRMSDTPIASQAMQRQALGLSDLLSSKANASLNLGLQGNQYLNNAALGFASALPSGSVAAFNPMFQERLAGGTTRMTGNTTGWNMSEHTPSTMTSIGQGIGLAGQLGAMGAGFMAPGVGGLAGGAGSSMGFDSGLSGLSRYTV
jgi:hypothetical protein